MDTYEEFDIVKAYEEQLDEYYRSAEDEQKVNYKSLPNFKKMICITVLMASAFLIGFVLAISNMVSPLIYEAIYFIPVALAVIFYKAKKEKQRRTK